eukprot:Nk52_evm18s1569 gene=Nk52_evmTU18s1569
MGQLKQESPEKGSIMKVDSSDDAAVKPTVALRNNVTTSLEDIDLNGLDPAEAPLIEMPPFTLSQLREAIPRHCFERSYLHSFKYLFVDVTVICSLFYVAYNFLNPVKVDTAALERYEVLAADTSGNWWGRYGAMLICALHSGTVLSQVCLGACWVAYWYVQGAVMTGLWVIAHECGHQAFSPSKKVNDLVGLFAHSFLLVPYHSWRISHGKHHSNTASIENDEVFVPSNRSELHGPNIVIDYLLGIAMLLVGWPMYLILNSSGPAKYRGKVNDHFNPKSVLFSIKNNSDIIVSDMFVAVAVGLMVLWTMEHSLLEYAMIYFIPYLQVNAYLVTITYLQHTHKKLPHFRSKEWTWLRGALATVDRDYGWFLNMCHHHISDTHMCHHIFSHIPHYHAQEATEALKPVLGKYYMYDDTGIWKSLFYNWANCRFVEDEGEILMMKKE